MSILKRFILGLLLVSAMQPVLADTYSGTLDVFESAPELAPFFRDAYAYVVFPVIGKGGIGIGGAFGKGRLYRQETYVGDVTVSKLTLGFQLGGQAFSELIFLEDERAFSEFTRGGFEFDATASAIAITAGAQAQAGTGGKSASAGIGPSSTAQNEYGYRKGMAIFVHPLGGLMYEAAVGGQKFTYTPVN